MALRIEWDKFEVALLIDACEQVLNKKISKPQVVSELSAALRLRAKKSGVEIDDIFRNENGISLQMTKMDYLLTDGKIGLPGASKLYAEIAELRKNNPEEFAHILNQAKEQIGKKEAKAMVDNKEYFSSWLSSHSTKKFTPEQIIKALEEGSNYSRSHGICKESFWSITEVSRISAISSRLLGMRLFRLTHRKLAIVLDQAIPLYKQFLKEQESIDKGIESQGKKEEPPVLGETYAKAPHITPVDLVYAKDDSDEEAKLKLDLITKTLLERYGIKPALSLSEIINNNKDIPVTYLNVWTKRVENQTAAQYLIAKGIIHKVVDTRSEEEKRAERLNKLNEVTSILLTRYSGKPITSLTELIKQNPDLAVSSVSLWSKEFFGQTASEYFRTKGILLPVVEKTTEEKLQDAIKQIKASLGDKQIHSLSEVKECGIGITIPTLNNWTKSVYGKPVSEYLIEENILVKDSAEQESEQSKEALYNSRNTRPDTENETYDDSDEEAIDAMELSLFKTLEYLKTRYNVRQHYDHIINSERTTLYKVRNGQKDIMWVYYIHTKSSHYISIETEPEYLEDMSVFPGFTRIQKRASHPRQKLFFEDFGAIWQTLVAICDSIDRYFAAFIPEHSQLNRTRLSEKLFSISKVYDDPAGISVARIMSMLGKEADEQVVLDILNNAPWAYRLSEDTYSFSKKTAPTTAKIGEINIGPSQNANLQEVPESDVSSLDSEVLGGSDELENTDSVQGQRPDPVIAFLDQMEIPYIDNRQKEGRLWILGDLSLKETTAWLRGQGYSFIYCYRGSKSTGWKSAWYLDESQEQKGKAQKRIPFPEEYGKRDGIEDGPALLSADLNQVLSDDDLQLLRSELVKQKILSLELFRRVDLWAFMKRNALYSTSQRQEIYKRIVARLSSSESTDYDYQYKLETSYIAFYGDTPAKAFVSFCEHIAEKYPQKIQTLLDEKYRGQGSVVLSKTNVSGNSIKMKNLEAYIMPYLSREAVIVYGHWISEMCGDNDPPIKLTPPPEQKKGVYLEPEKKTETVSSANTTNLSQEKQQTEVIVGQNAGSKTATIEAFQNYLLQVQNLAERTAGNYCTSIRMIEDYIQRNHLGVSFINSSASNIHERIELLMSRPDFIRINNGRHHQFSAAMAQYAAFLQSADKATDTLVEDKRKAATPCFGDSSWPSYETVLKIAFPKGFQKDSGLDMKKLRKRWAMVHGEELKDPDEAVRLQLASHCIDTGKRWYLAELILSDKDRQMVFDYIDRVFASGRKVLYYSSIYEALEHLLESSILTEDLLVSYLQATCQEKYIIHEHYLTNDRLAQVDLAEEIRDVMLARGTPIHTDELKRTLHHLPPEQIERELHMHQEFIMDAFHMYFHESMVELSPEELDQIAALIQEELDNHGYMIGDWIQRKISLQYPETAERLSFLSLLGVRGAIAYKLRKRFTFNGPVITPRGKAMNLIDIFAMFCQQHTSFTLDELSAFAKECDSTIYWDTVHNNCVRVSEKEFVATGAVHWNIPYVDAAIAIHCPNKYVPLKSIQYFDAFPFVGYQWNSFLLEHYLATTSTTFMLMHSSYAKNTASGAIVRRDAGFETYDDLLADVLANATVVLESKPCLEYLAANGFITRKKVANIAGIITRAKLLRTQKG